MGTSTPKTGTCKTQCPKPLGTLASHTSGKFPFPDHRGPPHLWEQSPRTYGNRVPTPWGGHLHTNCQVEVKAFHKRINICREKVKLEIIKNLAKFNMANNGAPDGRFKKWVEGLAISAETAAMDDMNSMS